MPLHLKNRLIENVRLIDDDATVRKSFGYKVENLNTTPSEVKGPIQNIEQLINEFDVDHDAVICDYNLKVSNYSAFNGDVIVSNLYKHHLPVVLCTRVTNMPESIKRKKRHIPVILTPDQLTTENIRNAFLLCLNEFDGKFTSTRRAWKTLIRIEGGEISSHADSIRVNVIIPSWDSSTMLEFDWEVGSNLALNTVKKNLQAGEISRIYATVNSGALNSEDIYIDEWSLK